jgi:hypothetical protein
LPGYVRDAQRRVQSIAARLEEGGPQGIIDDVGSFARRRPGTFLLCAAALGFVVGRTIRPVMAASSEMSNASTGPASTPMALPPPETPYGTYGEVAEDPFADHGSGVTTR